MPYWSSSRVGVVDGGPPGSNSRSARKGITMEVSSLCVCSLIAEVGSEAGLLGRVTNRCKIGTDFVSDGFRYRFVDGT